MITTLGDFSKYVAFHMSAWQPPSDNSDISQPIRRSSVREIQSPHMGIGIFMGPNGTVMADSYGFGLRNGQYKEGDTVVGHAGGLPGFGSDFRFMPHQNGIAVISMANHTYAPMAMLHKEILNKIRGVMDKAEIPPTSALEVRYCQLQNILVESSKICPGDPQTAIIWSNKNKTSFADNFFLDSSANVRFNIANDVINALGGTISHFTALVPLNNLRASFTAVGSNGRTAHIYFTLTPEKEPKIQELQIKLK